MTGVSKGKGIIIDTRPGVLAIPLLPRKADRRADKGGCKTKGDHRSDLEVDDGPDDLSEALFGEDLEVEKQERQLDEAEGGEVCDLTDPEQLEAPVSQGLQEDRDRLTRSVVVIWSKDPTFHMSRPRPVQDIL